VILLPEDDIRIERIETGRRFLFLSRRTTVVSIPGSAFRSELRIWNSHCESETVELPHQKKTRIPSSSAPASVVRVEEASRSSSRKLVEESVKRISDISPPQVELRISREPRHTRRPPVLRKAFDLPDVVLRLFYCDISDTVT